MDPRRNHDAVASFGSTVEGIVEIAARADPRFGITHYEPFRNKWRATMVRLLKARQAR
jgi:hypothetical protein